MAPARRPGYSWCVTRLLKHQPWVDGSRERSDGVDWNMWQIRQPPYHDLEVGDWVVLVSGGGPSGGMLTWEVEVTALVRDDTTHMQTRGRPCEPDSAILV